MRLFYILFFLLSSSNYFVTQAFKLSKLKHRSYQKTPLGFKYSSIYTNANHHLLSLGAINIKPLEYSPLHIWSWLSIAASSGIILEKTKLGSILSSPLLTMAITLILCNFGIVPSSHPIYDVVIKFLVPIAVPLLLLDADLKRCFVYMKQLFKAFVIGALGTIAGTFIAYLIIPMRSIENSYKIATALCARHIGGAINFISISEILKIPPELITATIAADNLVVAIYFTFLFVISPPDRNASSSRIEKSSDYSSEASLQNNESSAPKCPFPMFSASSSNSSQPDTSEFSLSTENQEGNSVIEKKEIRYGSKKESGAVESENLLVALTLGLILTNISEILAKLTHINPIMISSIIAVAFATFLPNTSYSLSKTGGIVGVALMQYFFAVTGAMGHIPTVLKTAPIIFFHSLIQISCHFVFSIGVGKLLKIPFREIVLASNANVGGPTTAAAMASNKRWKDLVFPALLTGVFGYVIATGVGLIVNTLLFRFFH